MSAVLALFGSNASFVDGLLQDYLVGTVETQKAKYALVMREVESQSARGAFGEVLHDLVFQLDYAEMVAQHFEEEQEQLRHEAELEVTRAWLRPPQPRHPIDRSNIFDSDSDEEQWLTEQESDEESDRESDVESDEGSDYDPDKVEARYWRFIEMRRRRLMGQESDEESDEEM